MAKEQQQPVDHKSPWLFIAWTVIALLAGLAIGIYQYQKLTTTNQKTVKKAPTEIGSDQELVAQVAKLILLPKEKPAIAIISNVDKIKALQPFFKNAEDGDRILVYTDQAIIYSPKKNLVINVGPISLIKTASDQNQIWKLEIRNGSSVKGAAAKLAEAYKDDKNFEITDVANAVNNEYVGNILVNLTDRDATQASQLLSATTTKALPEGEASSTADLLLIIGN